MLLSVLVFDNIDILKLCGYNMLKPNINKPSRFAKKSCEGKNDFVKKFMFW